jgi:hypothetical protein
MSGGSATRRALEVDFLMPTKGGGLRLIEAKAGSSARPEAGGSMLRLRDAIAKVHRRGKVEMVVAYASLQRETTVAEGLRAVGWRDMFAT